MLRQKFAVGIVAVALVGVTLLLGRALADDATYWLDWDSDSCSDDNDTHDCPYAMCSNSGAITCQSGDNYTDETLDKAESDGGANTKEDEGNPVDCWEPVTCTNDTHADMKCKKIILTAYHCVSNGTLYAGNTCYDCDRTDGDPETKDEDVLGDCAEE